MLRVNITEHYGVIPEVAIRFTHVIQDGKEVIPVPKGEVAKGCICEIFSGVVGTRDENKLLVGYGLSICHDQDMYEKRVGRRLSLVRAVESCTELTREDRRIIFTEYARLINNRW